MDKSHTLARKKWIKARAWVKERELLTEGRQVLRRERERASRKNFFSGRRRKHEGVSGWKLSCGRPEESRFHY